MLSQTYDIIFSGQLMEGSNLDKTRQQIGQIFKADVSQLDRLFSGKPVIIKSGVDDETATKYRIAFRKAGAVIDIKPTAIAADNSGETAGTAASPNATSDDLTLLPPNTGSLIDCAKQVTPQPIPDIDHISLASIGAVIDESPDPEPAEIDTSGLSVNPPNSGSLEDCKKEVEPYPIPDITHLDIDEP